MDFERFPPEVCFEIFSYLSVRDLFVCTAVCKAWKKLLDGEYEGGNVDGSLWSDVLDSSTPAKFRSSQMLKKLNAREKLIIYENTWNEHHISPNIYIKDDKLTTHRNPVAQSSDMARGKRGYLKGQHYWTVVWHGPKLGSNAVVGVVTSEEMIAGNGYYSLIGSSSESWGWDLSNSVLLHKTDLGTYPRDREIQVNLIF